MNNEQAKRVRTAKARMKVDFSLKKQKKKPTQIFHCFPREMDNKHLLPAINRHPKYNFHALEKKTK